MVYVYSALSRSHPFTIGHSFLSLQINCSQVTCQLLNWQTALTFIFFICQSVKNQTFFNLSQNKYRMIHVIVEENRPWVITEYFESLFDSCTYRARRINYSLRPKPVYNAHCKSDILVFKVWRILPRKWKWICVC